MLKLKDQIQFLFGILVASFDILKIIMFEVFGFFILLNFHSF